MLSYLGFDVRQSSMAIPFELKSVSLLFKARDIISILPSSLFSVRTVSYGLVFFVWIYGPSAKGKKLGPQLFWRKIFGHVIPTSREKSLPQLKILRHFERHSVGKLRT